MVIEKVHGLQATGMSLNDRFTMLAAAAPAPAPMRPRRRPSVGSSYNQNLSYKNRFIIEQIARRLEMQAKRQTVKQRLGGLRRFGSESSLPGLWRSNSFGNLSQASFKNRGNNNWRQSNGNLSRSGSFTNVAAGVWRGMKRRGTVPRTLRGRLRGMGNRQFNGRINRTTVRGRRGRWVPAGTRVGRGRGQTRGRGQLRGRGQVRGRGQARGRGRGRVQAQKPIPSREELDLQLDQYMANTKAALDRDIDNYMNNPMDQE